MYRITVLPVIALLSSMSGASAVAEVVIETATVGNPGNPPDTRYGFGGVDYIYKIGKFEVTAGQYTEFLNAVASEDTYGLYDTQMGNPGEWGFGCNIQRAGSSGSYTYSVDSDWADRPANYVDWGDAARFCNWLHNSQPTGAQGLGTTEDGSYFLDGAMSWAKLIAVTRNLDATWVIPSEDEWYKAAYHYNDGVTGNYWDYPTSSDSTPSNDLIDPDPGNNATFYENGYTIGSPYYRTKVGAHENSNSPYGTFDQGGNLWEWNEAILYGSVRGLRGGSCYLWGGGSYYLHAESRSYYPTYEFLGIGSRVAFVCGDRSSFTAFQSFADCLTGPGTLAAGTCICSDLDDDQAVDLYDFAMFQTNFTGPQ